ncbi:MAG: hypothetical protein ACT4QB_12295 [Gammaproteobacteria bacterium]
MKTLETDAEIHADGTLKLLSPIPDWLKTAGRRRLLLVATDLDDTPTGRTAEVGDMLKPGRAKAGLWKDLPGKFWMSSDFDDPLEHFTEYMR